MVKGALTGHMMENIGDAPLELLDADASVLLTNADVDVVMSIAFNNYDSHDSDVRLTSSPVLPLFRT